MPVQPAKSPLKPGALLAGKYRLQKLLGRGAAGVVWSATNITTSRKVALKLLLRPEPKQRERLLREARAAGALHHPNVIDIYDVTELPDGNPVLVLELLEGQTLQQLMDERAPLPSREAAGIGRDVARALAVAHASGIVHRDLKPSNIFMHQPGDDPPVVKVVDFGISKNLLAGEGTLTETGMAVGSPAFMSPEQVRGERKLDGRTDLWALGVLLWEMLAGRRLFDGRTHEVLTQVTVEPIKRLEKLIPGIEPDLAAVVHGLLERDLEARIASADEVAERLAVIAGGGVEPPRTRTAAPPAKPGEVHDTTVMPRPMTEPKNIVPKAYVDSEEDEPTHVAPFAMRAKLAQQTVPSVYTDDEEDEERTAVAPDAVLTAAIRASRENVVPDSSVPTVRPPAFDTGEHSSDQNAIPTVRPPPDLEAAEASPPEIKAPESKAPDTKSSPEAPAAPTRSAPSGSSRAPASARPGAPSGPPASGDVDFGRLLGSQRPPPPAAAAGNEPAGELFPTGSGPAAIEPAPPASIREQARDSTPVAPPQGRNKLMVAGAILFLVLAVVIFLTQLR